MNTDREMSAGDSVRHQKVGGLAALCLAAACLVAMLVGNHAGMQVMYLITYVILGIVLAVLAPALHARLKDRSPILAQVATAVGLMWAFVLVASGMIFNVGMTAVVGLNATNPAGAVSAWQAIEPVTAGLGGSGGELLGGLWVLLVSVTALRSRGLPRLLNWLGVAIGTAGLLSVVPVLRTLAYGFGLLQIAWFVWLGIVMLRTASRSAVSEQWRAETLGHRCTERQGAMVC